MINDNAGAGVVDERAAFERHFKSVGSLTVNQLAHARDTDGMPFYEHLPTRIAWSAWQARARLNPCRVQCKACGDFGSDCDECGAQEGVRVMSEELKLDRYEVTEGGGTFKCPGGEMVYYSDVKSFIADNNAALRAELATLKAGQGEAVAYEKPENYWAGFGYRDYSCAIELLKMVEHLESQLDAVPYGPLYTAPPASADAVPVPVELLLECVSQLETAGAWELPGKLSALLTQKH